MNYEEFISTVNASDPGTYWDRVKHNAHKDFQFKDLKIGKIYVFLDYGDTWFLTPTFLDSNDDYRVMWASHNSRKIGGGGLNEMTFRPVAGEACKGWDGYVWGGKKWIELNDTPPFNYINWTDNPFGVKL